MTIYHSLINLLKSGSKHGKLFTKSMITLSDNQITSIKESILINYDGVGWINEETILCQINTDNATLNITIPVYTETIFGTLTDLSYIKLQEISHKMESNPPIYIALTYNQKQIILDSIQALIRIKSMYKQDKILGKYLSYGKKEESK